MNWPILRIPSFLLLGLLLGSSSLPAATITANVPAVNVRKIPAVKQAVRRFLATKNVATGWNGNVALGNAGTVSDSYQQATLRAVNTFRALAGVRQITFDSDLNAKCAEAALMMSANRTLNHTPPATFTFFTAAGAEAAGNSNLCLGFGGVFAIPGYVDDSGSNNTIVGHRRWLLWSQSAGMGSGSVFSGGGFSAANALWVLPTAAFPAPSTRNGFIAWPYAGAIPNSFVFKRWSFSHPTADLTQATVRVKKGKKSIPVRIVDRDSTIGVGDRTVVFEPKGKYTGPNFNGTLLYPAHLKAPPRPEIYTVTVSNVNIAGAKKTFRYRVTVFPM